MLDFVSPVCRKFHPLEGLAKRAVLTALIGGRLVIPIETDGIQHWALASAVESCSSRYGQVLEMRIALACNFSRCVVWIARAALRPPPKDPAFAPHHHASQHLTQTAILYPTAQARALYPWSEDTAIACIPSRSSC